MSKAALSIAAPSEVRSQACRMSTDVNAPAPTSPMAAYPRRLAELRQWRPPSVVERTRVLGTEPFGAGAGTTTHATCALRALSTVGIDVAPLPKEESTVAQCRPPSDVFTTVCAVTPQPEEGDV